MNLNPWKRTIDEPLPTELPVAQLAPNLDEDPHAWPAYAGFGPTPATPFPWVQHSDPSAPATSEPSELSQPRGLTWDVQPAGLPRSDGSSEPLAVVASPTPYAERSPDPQVAVDSEPQPWADVQPVTDPADTFEPWAPVALEPLQPVVFAPEPNEPVPQAMRAAEPDLVDPFAFGAASFAPDLYLAEPTAPGPDIAEPPASGSDDMQRFGPTFYAPEPFAPPVELATEVVGVASDPVPGAGVPTAPAVYGSVGDTDPAEPEADEASGLWTFDTGVAVVQPRSASEVLGTLAGKVALGNIEQYQPVPLGFTPLDKTIGGGLRAGELLLVGGAQGTGKTTMALQMARNIVLGGQASVLYICFEHDEEYLLNRIIAMESVLQHLPQKTSGVKLQDVRREILGTWLAQGSENADLSTNPRLRPALERIGRYGQNLYLLRGSQTSSTIPTLHELVARYKKLSGDRRLVVFVDYMQKVPVHPEPSTETEKVTSIVNGLKDLALSMDVPMVSIVAADKEGLKASRLRNHHLRGSSAINYEADIILILNEKYQIVAKVNIEFNPYQAQRFRDWIICTIEKNRGGQSAVDLEFQKHFEYSCFDANGRTVQEKLIEERLYND